MTKVHRFDCPTCKGDTFAFVCAAEKINDEATFELGRFRECMNCHNCLPVKKRMSAKKRKFIYTLDWILSQEA